jgi:alkylation response protein AidB-like acyl-CoA dehydrogenase
VNFDLSEEQQVVSDLAAKLFSDLATTERVKAAEAGSGFDHDLWRELAAANVLGLCLPESAGGSGMGVLELALVATQQGRTVAPVPLAATVVTAMAIAEFGTPPLRDELLAGVTAGRVVLTSALAEPGANNVGTPSARAAPTADGYHLTGWRPAVPYVRQAARVVVPACFGDGDVALFAVDPGAPGVTVEPIETTDRLPRANVTLETDVVEHDRFGDADALRWLTDRMLVAQCAVQLGVAEAALAITASYTLQREQFGRALAAFQAVGQRAADCYITVEAMRVTTQRAAWRLDQGVDAGRDVAVAAWWAADGGQQVVLACQHLHGGVGADIDYPVHRYFLWGSQLANTLGTPASHLADLGQIIADGVGAG